MRARPLPMAPPLTGTGATNFPPYWLPMSHFMVALAWLLAASVGLLWAGPMLARGQWLTPTTAAVTHMFTLGWVLTSAYGTLHQLSPVALGITVRNWHLGYATLALHGAGTVAVVGGLLWWVPLLGGVGWLLVSAGLATWTWNVGSQLLRAPRANHQARIAAAAFAFLWLAVLVAGARMGNALGWWMVPREAVVAAHIQLALLGFGTLLIMGIGSHIIPMFLLARHAPDGAGMVAAPLLAIGTLVQAAGWLGGNEVLTLAGAVVAAGGAVAFLAQVRAWLGHRHRDALDASLRQALAALALLALAIPIGFGALLLDNPRLVGSWGVLMLVGWLSLLVGAVYGRVLPFLTWLEHYRKQAGKPGVPKIGEMVSPDALGRIAALWVGGTLVLVLSVLVGAPVAAAVAAMAFALGSVWAFVTYLRLVARPPAPQREE